jgi:glucan-binding YG repeat protein
MTMGMFKKIVMGVVGTIATAYVTKAITDALERKPLKARIRSGKNKVMQMKDVAATKAVELKDTAATKAATAKHAARSKAEELKASAKARADELIEERPVVTKHEMPGEDYKDM